MYLNIERISEVVLLRSPRANSTSSSRPNSRYRSRACNASSTTQNARSAHRFTGRVETYAHRDFLHTPRNRNLTQEQSISIERLSPHRLTFGISGVVIQGQCNVDDASVAAEDLLQVFVAKQEISFVHERSKSSNERSLISNRNLLLWRSCCGSCGCCVTCLGLGATASFLALERAEKSFVAWLFD